MASEVCEHCQEPLRRAEAVAVRDRYSYHMECHKCYVCGETDLQEAELFKGVIFCSKCAQRIFQGCATARRAKDPVHGRHSNNIRHRAADRRHRNSVDGILELSTLAASTDSSDRRVSSKFKSSSSNLKISSAHSNASAKKPTEKHSSVDMGMTTEITQELLKQMNCPVVEEIRKHAPPAKPRKKRRDQSKKKTNCSDLRMAELGASTEIANMALKNKSELPIIVQSEPRILKLVTKSKSTKESSGGSGEQEYIDSEYSSEDSEFTPWLDRRIGSLLKIPYKIFWKKVVRRSSLISVLNSSRNSRTNLRIKKKMKNLFKDELVEHQKKGIRRLYSTINRQKSPHKLGWLDSCSSEIKRSSHQSQKRCKHFCNSHSYRCMRAQVMKLAGPTESELAVFRSKVVDLISPAFYRKKVPAIVTSQACGNSS